MKSLLILLALCAACLAMETNATTPALPGTSWTVVTLAGQTPLAEHPITFEFDADGNIAGNASCNRFGGACTIEGDTIKVGPLRCTRRACEPDVMQQEHKFLALLGAITNWKIDAEGALVLHSEDGEIHASRAPAEPAPQP